MWRRLGRDIGRFGESHHATRAIRSGYLELSFELPRQGLHQAEAGRTLGGRLEIEARSVVLDIELDLLVRGDEADPYLAIVARQAVLHRVGDELVEDERHRHGGIVAQGAFRLFDRDPDIAAEGVLGHPADAMSGSRSN